MWSEEELKILREYYPIEGAAIVNRLPNRTLKSIQSQASRLKIPGCKLWTTQEIQILNNYYNLEGAKIIKRLPNRSIRAIQVKAHALGLSTINWWSDEEIDILIEFYPTEGPDCVTRLPKRTRDAVRTTANVIGVYYNNLDKYYNTTSVYCIYFKDINVYKVGVTNDINTRIKSFGCEAELIYIVKTESYLEAKKLEQKILSIVQKANTGLLNSGNTETFIASKENIQIISTYFKFNS